MPFRPAWGIVWDPVSKMTTKPSGLHSHKSKNGWCRLVMTEQPRGPVEMWDWAADGAL